MRISDAKRLLSSVVIYNMEQAAAGKSHNTFIVPMFVGDPGSGKTAIPVQVAEELDMSYAQTIVAQYDAGEMAGLPMANLEKGEMFRLRPHYLPADPHGGIWNLDELPQAFLANQNICSQIVNEYRIGEHHIPPTWTICATGNKPENKAGTTTMPTHLRDRLTFITVEPVVEDWLDWAAENGVDHRVRAYIRQNPTKLNDFKPSENSNPTSRSWAKTSALIGMGFENHVRSEAIQGQIGTGHATAFEAWLRVEDRMPKIEDIIKHPKQAPIFGTKDADVLYMLIAALADYADDKTIEPIIEYINRLQNQEFSVYFMHDALRRNKDLAEHKAVTKWKVQRGTDLLF
ncbi:MAG TPA: hypothetical protein VGK56_01290 [Anaerolineales bacterium]